MLNESEDNDSDNLISLSFQDHFMIHYYYYTLAKEKFKSRMALAFKLMTDTEVGSIKELTSIEMAEKIAKAHQEATELSNEFSSINGKTRIVSEETRKQIANKLKGHYISEETRRKISVSKTGQKWTEEQKARLSEQRMGHPNYLTEEGKRKIAIAKTGQKHTEETKIKMSNSQRGKHHKSHGPLTEEHKQKVSESLKGIKRNDETKEKIGASKRGKHYIHINGKRKLVGPDYINNVEENNE